MWGHMGFSGRVVNASRRDAVSVTSMTKAAPPRGARMCRRAWSPCVDTWGLARRHPAGVHVFPLRRETTGMSIMCHYDAAYFSFAIFPLLFFFFYLIKTWPSGEFSLTLPRHYENMTPYQRTNSSLKIKKQYRNEKRHPSFRLPRSRFQRHVK